MVAKKHKSKRTTLHDKYKIQKKVAEHHRKQRKEAKKSPQRKKLKKDPGIPNLFPLKEKLLMQAEEMKAKAIQEKQMERDALKAMVVEAEKRANEFTESAVEENVAFQDNSRKYYREFKKVVESADVILEVLDARDPLGCRTREIEELIVSSNKRVVLVLNKVDLVPKENFQKWLKYLRNEFPTVAFKSSTQSQRSNLGQSNDLNSSECMGADNLIKLLKNYCRNVNIKTSITVGVVGFPNVGKSSLINSLKRAKVCNVGSTPGVTKVTQSIHLDKNIKLLDCPGIVFARVTDSKDLAPVLLRNCVRVEQLEDPVAPIEYLISCCSKDALINLYGIPYFETAQDFLVLLARLKGKLKRHGIPDIESAARAVIQDWNQGKIPYYTNPPASPFSSHHLSSSIVTTWSQEFSLPDIVQVEGSQLDALETKQDKMIPMSLAPTTSVDMDVELQVESDSDTMVQDDEDIMEEEPMATEPMDTPTIQIQQVKKKNKVIEQEDVLDQEEMDLNPQHNAQQRKAFKNQKKANRKIKKRAMDTYDFDEQFE